MPGALHLLKALSEPVRIRFYLLLRKTSLTVSELSEILGISQSNTSHHVKALRELDLLTAEKIGQHTYYALDSATLRVPRIAAVLKMLEDAADEIPEIRNDAAKLRTVLAMRNGDNFSRWRMEQPDLPYSDIFAHLACGRRGRVVDIGCGEGDFFEALRLSFSEVVAVDIDQAHTRRALARAQNLSNIHIVCTDAQYLPLSPASADAVILRMALSQIPDWATALHEALRICKPGGFISVIDSDLQTNHDFRTAVTELLHREKTVRLDSERMLPGLFMLRAEKLA